ncbi:hypothetical protein [Streptomyces sp. CBMA152]|uniref:hypothetical protein n=1 Tax=Streptomyces sp. CBMA152 TaxID=1896312 RepID=UPI00166136E0|nr:hypothetical protein [Streptomyces sp. CBMA152]MBD0745952.1 hypothetical protein [Streptomyces sp. CBMA152]
MASGLRTLGAGTALAGLLFLTPSAYADESSPAPATPSLSLDQRLAGRKAGEGRARPGRAPETLPYVPDASAEPIPAAVPTPTPPVAPSSALPAAAARKKASPGRLSTSSELRVHVLSMGAGLALTGLGLAFLALRLRRP